MLVPAYSERRGLLHYHPTILILAISRSLPLVGHSGSGSHIFSSASHAHDKERKTLCTSTFSSVAGITYCHPTIRQVGKWQSEKNTAYSSVAISRVEVMTVWRILLNYSMKRVLVNDSVKRVLANASFWREFWQMTASGGSKDKWQSEEITGKCLKRIPISDWVSRE